MTFDIIVSMLTIFFGQIRVKASIVYFGHFMSIIQMNQVRIFDAIFQTFDTTRVFPEYSLVVIVSVACDRVEKTLGKQGQVGASMR